MTTILTRLYYRFLIPSEISDPFRVFVSAGSGIAILDDHLIPFSRWRWRK